MRKMKLRQAEYMLKVPQWSQGLDLFLFDVKIHIFKFLLPQIILIIIWDHGCEDALQRLEVL